MRTSRKRAVAIVAVAAALSLFRATSVDSALAAVTPPPAGFTARFTGALEGTARGGTSEGCVFTARPTDPNQGPVPSPLLLPRLVTMKWSNFTVKKKQASMTFLVGAPTAGNPTQPNPIPWQPGGADRRGRAHGDHAERQLLVTTADAKPVSSDVTAGVTVDVTLKPGKKKLHVKALFNCEQAGVSGDVPTR